MTDVICDDRVLMHLQYSTQWDSSPTSAAVRRQRRRQAPRACLYNGYRAGAESFPPTDAADAGVLGRGYEGRPRAKALGIQNMAEQGAQGRGVMIDLHATTLAASRTRSATTS